MKTKLLLTAFVGLVAAGAAVFAKADKSAKPAADVVVTFAAPEKFTDAKDSYMDTERGREAVLTEISEHLVAQAGRYLAAGERLEITVTDVDLAGDFEPWRGMHFDDIRIVKDIYPPRVSLEFRRLAADGRILSEGRRELRDLGYMLTVALRTSDPLRYDKELLSDWLRREFKRPA
jgi:hypothetical protein